MARRFQRRIEDFVCERCGRAVAGDGFTNHCPACLWSKHVDRQPGDRAAGCGGLMAPVALESRAEGYLLTHRCERCGHEKRNRSDPADDTAAILALARRLADPRR